MGRVPANRDQQADKRHRTHHLKQFPERGTVHPVSIGHAHHRTRSRGWLGRYRRRRHGVCPSLRSRLGRSLLNMSLVMPVIGLSGRVFIHCILHIGNHSTDMGCACPFKQS
ncbi:hypothetical protein AA0472_0327 [Acetobacter estunensis NRIC 0472]|nr:hypothetical protein AA0472_0327 [Acetobacter estunensis NRIC 0472]